MKRLYIALLVAFGSTTYVMAGTGIDLRSPGGKAGAGDSFGSHVATITVQAPFGIYTATFGVGGLLVVSLTSTSVQVGPLTVQEQVRASKSAFVASDVSNKGYGFENDDGLGYSAGLRYANSPPDTISLRNQSGLYFTLDPVGIDYTGVGLVNFGSGGAPTAPLIKMGATNPGGLYDNFLDGSVEIAAGGRSVAWFDAFDGRFHLNYDTTTINPNFDKLGAPYLLTISSSGRKASAQTKNMYFGIRHKANQETVFEVDEPTSAFYTQLRVEPSTRATSFSDYLLSVASSPRVTGAAKINIISVSSSGYSNFASSTDIHVLSSCGTSPTIRGGGNAFTVTPGGGAPAACTITFAKPFKNPGHPIIFPWTGSVLNTFSLTSFDNVSMTVSETGLGTFTVWLAGAD